MAAAEQNGRGLPFSSLAGLVRDAREQKALAPPKPKPPQMIGWMTGGSRAKM